MPRLSPALLRRAWHTNPLLPVLLHQCRDLASAKNELRWITEHVKEHYASTTQHENLQSLCTKRGRGYPLQYLLGSQPFGNLDILCRKGVLIPRPETETYTAHLADLLKKETKSSENLKILDLCTGTGAIPLMLYDLLHPYYQKMEVIGLDLSTQAIKLAKHNVAQNKASLGDCRDRIAFVQADVLQPDFIQEMRTEQSAGFDIIISNPPYISTTSYWKDTSRSARIFEPISALVPPTHIPSHLDMRHLQVEDVFYSAIVALAEIAVPRFLLMEVADMEQAKRVVRHTHEKELFKSVEIWRDWPMDGSVEGVHDGEVSYKIRGSGHGRSVFCRI